MDVFSDAQLFSYMEDIARRVIDKCTEEILTNFKEDFVSKMAYVDGSPKKYIRTWEFKNAWRWSDIKKSANEISTKMFYDWATMPTQSPRSTPQFTHTTFTSEKTKWANDARPFLDKSLNNLNRSVFLTGDRPKNYWDEFISGYVESGKLKQVIDKHAKASGLEVSVSY